MAPSSPSETGASHHSQPSQRSPQMRQSGLRSALCGFYTHIMVVWLSLTGTRGTHGYGCRTASRILDVLLCRRVRHR